ncbi:MAG: hypothetical protein QF666_03340 [Alphaproteobacteria bacterium]|jgi:cbb3-type cytochrome oxidase subunit 1|nr:hypothetical protein [Alphaproteobacteria bacterium]
MTSHIRECQHMSFGIWQILIILAVVFICVLGLPIVSAVIARRKGRSSVGWFILTLICPLAILFIAMLAPIRNSSE